MCKKDDLPRLLEWISIFFIHKKYSVSEKGKSSLEKVVWDIFLLQFSS